MKHLNNYITEALVKKHVTPLNIPVGYVSLDLPSGTLWAKYDGDGENSENTTYSLTTAKKLMHDNVSLPTIEQFKELLSVCTVTELGDGRIKVFRNGKEIFMRDDIYHVIDTHNYWGCYYNVPKDAWSDQRDEYHRVKLVVNIDKQAQ